MSDSPYTPEQVEALKREHEGYVIRGRSDRADLVAAELRKAGEKVDSAPRGRRSQQNERA